MNNYSDSLPTLRATSDYRRGWETDPHVQVRNVETIARWLDDHYIDPIIGFLFPGAGDLISSLFGLYTIAAASRLRLPRIVIARMFLNLALDTAFGSIPIVGDIFDVFFKAHRRNAELLRVRVTTGQSTPMDWLLVLGAAVLFFTALALPIVIIASIIAALT